MSKLIKAEFYRITHSGTFFPLLLITGALPIVLAFLSTTNMEEVNFFTSLSVYSQGASYTVSALISVVMSAMISNMYHNRTYYYEIMNGERIYKIIFSKLTVYNGLSVVIVIIPAIIVLLVVWVKKGSGGMQDPLLSALLGTVLIINITSVTILMSMIIRHILACPIFLYTFNCLIFGVYLSLEVISSDSLKFLKKILGLLPQTQIMELAQPKYSASFIIKVTGSFIVLFTLLYTLTYLSYKKKNYK